MTAGIPRAQPVQGVPTAGDDAACRLGRRAVIALGLSAAVLFTIVGCVFRLQEYGDGSIFSYAVAVRDAWTFHWHNIAARAFVYVYALLPGEIAVALTGSAETGIALYGLLFFAAPLIGLVATAGLDRSPRRLLLAGACLSSAGLAPVVFGFPTEMWLAHAVFWPALAASHYAPRTGAGALAVFVLLLALVHCHEGGIVFALAILATLALRGWRDAALRRAAAAFALALAVWAAVKLTWPPDPYYAPILFRAAFYFIDLRSLGDDLFLLLYAAVAAYGLAWAALRRAGVAAPAAAAAALTALGLAVYWRWFDHALHADHRYAARTALLLGTPLLGAFAAAFAVRAEGRLALRVPLLPALLDALARRADARALVGALAVVALVHVVETAKFAAGWTAYVEAVRGLATGTAADPELGDPAFVSAARLGPALNRLAWNSTTPYLSVLVAPGHVPARLVVDPSTNYFWLPCPVATASARADAAIPAESRRLLRIYSCLHR